MYNRRFTPDRIEHLNKNEVFVFGSNLAGQHGGGAARIAYGEFGAIWGQGVGMQGQSYAIPTMHGGVAEIKPYVDQFIEYAKQHPDEAKHRKCQSWEALLPRIAIQPPCFGEIRNCRRDKKDCNVDPIGRGADHPIVGVEKHRNENQAKENSAKLHTPKIRSVTEEKTLNGGKNKHRQEEKLHMLPGGFIYTREEGDKDCLPKPIV